MVIRCQTRILGRLACVVALGVGCAGRSAGGDGAAETGGSSTEETGGAGGGTTGTAGDGTSSDSASTSAGVGSGTETASSEGTSAGDTTTTESSDSGTTTTWTCSIFDEAYERVELNATWEDCGYVALGGPQPDWTTASECARIAEQEERGFVVLWELQGIDSEVIYAYVGLAGGVYAIERFEWDGPPMGNMAVTKHTCEDLLPMDGCVPQSGYLCLDCLNPSSFELVCEW